MGQSAVEAEEEKMKEEAKDDSAVTMETGEPATCCCRKVLLIN